MGTPNISRNAGQALFHKYDDNVGSTVIDIFSGKGNLYGLYYENNDSADVYVQLFLKPASQVVLGTTVPDFTYRINGQTAFGRDPSVHVLKHCPNGLSAAVTTSRTGSTAPANGATLQHWYWNV